ncbi:MAG TPA: non-ribosomal peptide synthetase, partial [Longimicrobium sp.]|nr:non-ribosomal peptide synthetase [Longimicrobium sp.]
PKGVAIEHGSVVALLAWAAELHSAEELGGMLASTSICFDLSVYELFLPLTRGGRVIVVENALSLPASPAAGEVRVINTVPSAIAALLRTGGIPAGVTTVNLAGEPLRTELVDALYAHGIQRVFDLYGPSEDTTYSTFALRRAGEPATIGQPIANTRAYVLHAGMRPVPVGVPGELYLGGRGLARGYLGRPALTAGRFLPDPFGAEPGGRLYRTGDRVRVRECESARVRKGEGDSDPILALSHSRTFALEYLGRLDAQVKIRGYRIELGEIETVLRRHAAVRDCVVIAAEDGAGEKQLAAYVVGDASADGLRAHLRHSLPEYMVPAAFVRMEALPLTPNGKLDRAALPAPEPVSTLERYVAPRTPVEEALAEIWADLLGVERVGVHDGFFDLGGHSLLATRLVWRIRQALEGEVDVSAVFDTPTIAALAPRLSERRPRPAPAAATLSNPRHLLEMVDELSDEELDRLLGATADYQTPP